MYGRRILISDEVEITRENILRVLDDVSSAHSANRSEIKYLWNYYKGKQPILERQKTVRPEICNKIVENRANEIVSFKLGYLCGEPIQYIARGAEPDVAEGVSKLNEMMFLENKPSFDRELIEWQLICGTSFRMVLPDDAAEKDEVPFEIYTLDPRNTFVVYSNRVGNKPLMGVTYTEDTKNNEKTYCIYTKDEYFEVKARVVIKQEKHLPMIPLRGTRKSPLPAPRPITTSQKREWTTLSRGPCFPVKRQAVLRPPSIPITSISLTVGVLRYGLVIGSMVLIVGFGFCTVTMFRLSRARASALACFTTPPKRGCGGHLPPHRVTTERMITSWLLMGRTSEVAPNASLYVTAKMDDVDEYTAELIEGGIL